MVSYHLRRLTPRRLCSRDRDCEIDKVCSLIQQGILKLTCNPYIYLQPPDTGDFNIYMYNTALYRSTMQAGGRRPCRVGVVLPLAGASS
jgi:hypothetical protein